MSHREVLGKSLMYLQHAMKTDTRAPLGYNNEYSEHVLGGWHKPYIDGLHKRLKRAVKNNAADAQLYHDTHAVLNGMNAQHGSPLKYGYGPHSYATREEKNKLDDEFEAHVKKLRV